MMLKRQQTKMTMASPHEQRRWVSSLAVLALAITCATAAMGPERNIKLVNDSGAKLEVFWIHPDTKEGHAISTSAGVVDGSTMPLNTFVGHSFEVREMPSGDSGECTSNKEKTCRVANFEAEDANNQVIKILPDFDIDRTDETNQGQEEEASQVVAKCRVKAQKQLHAGVAGEDIVETLATCVESGVAKRLESINEEISFQAKVRSDMASILENYTCVDDSIAESTPDVSTEEWDDLKGVNRTVHIKHDRPASQIHVIENFIDEEECQAMEETARRTLHRATVADGKGGSRLSENRKAMQAGIKVQWKKEEEGDPIARISRRVYDYTNHVLGLDIQEHGQEDLMSIQYFGRGRNDTEPDRYTPHCDGDCTGLPHKTGTRMATMVMYCTLPSEGGATNFRNSGVHVKPVSGNAIFFSYMNPETKVMDNGFTEHSGCPVYEGEKKIVTQWIRYGVDMENPWNSFNTLGIKLTEAAGQ